MASTLSSCTFLLIFWFLPVFVVVSLVNDLLSHRINDLSMTNILVVPSRQYSYAPIERFYCLSLKAIDFNDVDSTGFRGKLWF